MQPANLACSAARKSSLSFLPLTRSRAHRTKMSGLDWQAPDFLSNTNQDDCSSPPLCSPSNLNLANESTLSPMIDLASLASFLDGPQSKYPTQDLSVYGTQLAQFGGLAGGQTGQSPSSPELTSDSGASPSSSNDGQNGKRRSTGGSGDLSLSSHQAISHDKRKNGSNTTQAIKDRRSSHGKSTAPLPHHSHPDGIDGDITRSELNRSVLLPVLALPR